MMKFGLILFLSLIPHLGGASEAGAQPTEEVPYFDHYWEFFPQLKAVAAVHKFDKFIDIMSTSPEVVAPIHREGKLSGVRVILPGPKKNYWVAVHIEDSMYEVDRPVHRLAKRRRTSSQKPANRHHALPFYSETFPQEEGSRSLYLKAFHIPGGIATTMDTCIDQEAFLILRIDESPTHRCSETIKVAAKDIVDENGEPFRITGREIMTAWQQVFLKAFSVSTDYLHDDADLGSLSTLKTYSHLKFKLRYLAALTDEPTYYEKFGYRISRLTYQDAIQINGDHEETAPVVQIPEIYQLAKRLISRFTFKEIFDLHQKLSPNIASEGSRREFDAIKSFLRGQDFQPDSTMQEIFSALKTRSRDDRKVHQEMLQVYSYCVADIVAISLAPTPEQEKCILLPKERAYIAAFDIIDNAKYLVRNEECDGLNEEICRSSFLDIFTKIEETLRTWSTSPDRDRIKSSLLEGKTAAEQDKIGEYFRRPTQQLVMPEAWLHFLTLSTIEDSEKT